VAATAEVFNSDLSNDRGVGRFIVKAPDGPELLSAVGTVGHGQELNAGRLPDAVLGLEGGPDVWDNYWSTNAADSATVA
jgi:hypothetical protein